MVAFEEDLIAAAHAHHFVANGAEARVFISGAKEGEDCEAQQSKKTPAFQR